MLTDARQRPKPLPNPVSFRSRDRHHHAADSPTLLHFPLSSVPDQEELVLTGRRTGRSCQYRARAKRNQKLTSAVHAHARAASQPLVSASQHTPTSARTQRSSPISAFTTKSKTYLAIPRATASPVAIGHPIDSVAACLKTEDLTRDEDMYGDCELRR